LDDGKNVDMGKEYLYPSKKIGPKLAKKLNAFNLYTENFVGMNKELGTGITGLVSSEENAGLLDSVKVSEIIADIKKLEDKNAKDLTKRKNMMGLFGGLGARIPSGEDIKNKGNYDYNYNIIYKILKTIIRRLTFGEKICNNRLIEGKYINQSLANIRNTISDIVSYKNNKTILAIPDIEDECLKQYKKGCGENCFSLTPKSIESNTSIPSEIFNDIKGFIEKSDCRDNYGTDEFYDDILVSVFCVANFTESVFDNSGGAPPTPHIDLNEIYEAFYNYGGILPGRTSRGVIKQGTTESITDDFKNALSNLLIKIQYYLEEKPYPKIDNFFNEGEIPPVFKLKAGDKPDEIKKRITGAKDDDLDILNVYLTSILQKIENSNAVTTIGTLEFIDKISKYQLTNTICMGDSSETGGE
jgi:hypothetical protein